MKTLVLAVIVVAINTNSGINSAASTGRIDSRVQAGQARDAASSQKSLSSRVSGIVVDAADGQRPIRRAMVSLDGPIQVSQVTGDDGRFVFEDVVPGEYNVPCVMSRSAQ